jgi:hypothetical protein
MPCCGGPRIASSEAGSGGARGGILRPEQAECLSLDPPGGPVTLPLVTRMLGLPQDTRRYADQAGCHPANLDNLGQVPAFAFVEVSPTI